MMQGESLNLERTIDDEPSSQVFLEVAAATDVGCKRANNEDAVAVSLREDRSGALLVVADGMGGHTSGEVASGFVVAELVRQYETGLLTDTGALAEAIRVADREISERWPGSGTTVVAALVTESQASIGHVGDSRAYLFRDGSLVALTRDHTLVRELLSHGSITEQQAQNHPRRHVLLQAVGTGRQDPPDTRLLRIQGGDVLVLESDGLHGVVAEPELRSALRECVSRCAPAAETAETLVSMALAEGAPDNVSVAILLVKELCA